MEDPDSIAIAEIFILHFLCSLIQPNGNLLLLLLGSGPSIKDGLLLEVQIVILDFQPLVNLDVEEGCGVERDVDVDILLVIEARLQVEDAKLGGNLQQFQNVLVGLLILDVGEILGTVDMLQHEVLVVLDGEFILLLHQIIILAQLKFKLVDEDLNLLLRHLHALLRLVPFFEQPLQELFGLEFDDGRDFEEGHAGFGGAVAGG